MENKTATFTVTDQRGELRGWFEVGSSRVRLYRLKQDGGVDQEWMTTQQAKLAMRRMQNAGYIIAFEVPDEW